MAEYFRDAEGQDVLLFVDNIFRFTQVRPKLVLHPSLAYPAPLHKARLLRSYQGPAAEAA